MAKSQVKNYPEMWGGVECTINRCQNTYKDQLSLSKHYERPGDLEAFSKLGMKALRYPILWEKHGADENGVIDWTWTAGQLTTIRKLNMQLIAGLLHHGSGPALTSLLDKNFPVKLAAYAKKVARRFPWIEYYTPVNEPLTTARFSGLYGLWYPHQKNDRDFLTMLLNQLEAVVLSMKAIREVNPHAKLVQTEDMGKTHSTSKLAYQANFENHRRWLTYDLLCGKVNIHHPLWNYFIDNGITRERLIFFTENICTPHIIGFNHYVTSERYLDDRLENFPACVRGSNGRHDYVDVEAVRYVKPSGIKKLLTEVWNRYQVPIAITEAHLHCSREDQLRWFKEIWDSCCSLIKKGINIKAVTAWSLLGAFDWNSLLVRDAGFYETGIFDISNNKLRPTAMVKLISSLSATGKYDHPILQGKGWWHRHNPIKKNDIASKNRASEKPLLIIGKTGALANAFKIICEQRGINYVILSRDDIEITNEIMVERIFKIINPWGVINAAGYVNVDNAESEIQKCFAINSIAPGVLAECCKKPAIPFMHFSSDMVFNGDKRTPYLETDQVLPINIYGKSKVEGENAVSLANPQALIIRTSAFFGPWDKYNFVYKVIRSLKQQSYCTVVKDFKISPTYLPDLVNASLDLFIDESQGTWHVSNGGGITWADFAEEIIKRSGYTNKHIVVKNASELNWKAKRPFYSVLESEKGIKLPVLGNALERYFTDKAVE